MMMEFMKEVDTLFIFFYFLTKAVPVFFKFLGCFLEFVFNWMEKDKD